MVGKRPNPWIVVLVVMLPACLELLDTGILNVVLPNIAATYGETMQNSTWVLTAYLVASAVVLPISGWFSEVFGRKRYFLTNIIVFGIGTLGCYLAPNFITFLLCRILQGFSGGGLLPPAQAIIYEAFEGDEKKRSLGQALFGMGLVVAPSLGPYFGGWFASNMAWHDVYILYFPIIIVGAFLVYLFLHDTRESALKQKKKIPIDYVGLALLVVGLGSLQIFLSNGQTNNWFQSREIQILCAMSVICLISLLIWELYTPYPLIKLHIFKIRNVAAAMIVIFFAGVLIYGVNLMIPQYLQIILGYTAQDAGLILSLAAMFTIPIMPIVAYGVIQIGYKRMILFGLVVCGISVLIMSKFSPLMSGSMAFNGRLVLAVGFGFIMMPVNMCAIAFVKNPRDYDDISGMLNLFRSVGGSIGIALIETLISRMEQVHQVYLMQNINPFNMNFNHFFQGLTHGGLSVQQSYQTISLMVRQQAMALSYSDGFFFCLIFIIILIPVVILMVKSKKVDKVHFGE